MFYRPCPDIPAPIEADLDDPAMAEAAVAVERGEQDVRMLARLAEIGMELAEALCAHAGARLAVVDGKASPLAPGEDPTAPFNRVAQTVRRTLALKAKFTEDVKIRRSGLMTERAARRARRAADHRIAKRVAIEETFREALGEDHPYPEGEAVRRLISEMHEQLDDGDEFRDFLDRRVGETVSRLCRALGVDCGLCVPDGDGWKVRRAPFPMEKALMGRRSPSDGRPTQDRSVPPHRRSSA